MSDFFLVGPFVLFFQDLVMVSKNNFNNVDHIVSSSKKNIFFIIIVRNCYCPISIFWSEIILNDCNNSPPFWLCCILICIKWNNLNHADYLNPLSIGRIFIDVSTSLRQIGIFILFSGCTVILLKPYRLNPQIVTLTLFYQLNLKHQDRKINIRETGTSDVLPPKKCIFVPTGATISPLSPVLTKWSRDQMHHYRQPTTLVETFLYKWWLTVTYSNNNFSYLTRTANTYS